MTSYRNNVHLHLYCLLLTLTTLSVTYVVQTLITMTADRNICPFYCRYFEVIESQSQKFGMPRNLSLMYSKVIQVGFAFEI